MLGGGSWFRGLEWGVGCGEGECVRRVWVCRSWGVRRCGGEWGDFLRVWRVCFRTPDGGAGLRAGSVGVRAVGEESMGSVWGREGGRSWRGGDIMWGVESVRWGGEGGGGLMPVGWEEAVVGCVRGVEEESMWSTEVSRMVGRGGGGGGVVAGKGVGSEG